MLWTTDEWKHFSKVLISLIILSYHAIKCPLYVYVRALHCMRMHTQPCLCAPLLDSHAFLRCLLVLHFHKLHLASKSFWHFELIWFTFDGRAGLPKATPGGVPTHKHTHTHHTHTRMKRRAQSRANVLQCTYSWLGVSWVKVDPVVVVSFLLSQFIDLWLVKDLAPISLSSKTHVRLVKYLKYCWHVKRSA